MKNLANISIKARLAIIVSLLAGMVVVQMLAGMWSTRLVHADLENLYHEGLEPMAELAEFVVMQQQVVTDLVAIQGVLAILGRQPANESIASIRTRTTALDAMWEDFKRARGDNELDAEFVAQFEEQRTEWMASGVDPVLRFYEAGNVNRANNVLVRFVIPEYQNMVAAATEAMSRNVANGQALEAAAEQRAKRAATWLALGAMLAILISVALAAWIISRSFVQPMKKVVAAARKMAAGDLDFKLEANAQDEVGEVVTAVAAVQQSVQRMATDTKTLSRAAVAGKLGTRADASKHEGDFREIVEGINGTLDAVIGPLNVAADYVENIAKGNIPAKITDEYKGDFNALKNNLNTCIEAVNGLITDANMLSQAAVEGKLDTRADVTHHEGDFRRIVAGVNDTLDAVVGPINEVKRVMIALADGDLTQQIDGHYAGEFKVLQVAVNDSLTKLNELVSGIKGSADAINTAAKEIAAGNTNLSQRTEEQASSLEETASSMEELTSTVKQNADNARQANQLAHGASDVATKGGDKVREVVVTMGAITESSKKISDIIQVIDGIAFQTNILALNAAVEAARAGEQGRGFAVVAGEVRTLAQRSAAAAKEIKTLINHSVETVEGGSKLVEQAGATMEEIVSAVKRVTDIMAEISAASDEQSQGIEQVSTAVAQMDEVTQQNAALVEESAAAASSLEDQAHGLAEAVAVFRIDNATASGIANPRRSVAAPAAAPKPKAKPQPAKPAAQRKAPKPAALADAGEEWAEF